jgi:hypothetical protein
LWLSPRSGEGLSQARIYAASGYGRTNAGQHFVLRTDERTAGSSSEFVCCLVEISEIELMARLELIPRLLLIG